MEYSLMGRMWRIIAGFCCAGCLYFVSALGLAAEARYLVLVSGAMSNVPQLTPTEVRKLFLGVKLIKDGQRIEPLLNATEPLLNEVFLQKIIFMSADNYQRQLNARIAATGDPRPQEYFDRWQLISALRTRRGSVTFMWNKDVRVQAGLKVIQELWQIPLE